MTRVKVLPFPGGVACIHKRPTVDEFRVCGRVTTESRREEKFAETAGGGWGLGLVRCCPGLSVQEAALGPTMVASLLSMISASSCPRESSCSPDWSTVRRS